LAVWATRLRGIHPLLASGYLAFGEICHTYWAWKPQSLPWWMTFTNLLGRVAFVPKEEFPFNAAQISVFFILPWRLQIPRRVPPRAAGSLRRRFAPELLVSNFAMQASE
jgi:hypothetical protein